MSRLMWKLGPPASPSTSSVEPPPMSTTSTERISKRPSVAPRKARRASSLPESKRTLKPNRRSISLRNSPPFDASRTALVATTSVGAASSLSTISAYSESVSCTRSMPAVERTPLSSTPSPRRVITVRRSSSSSFERATSATISRVVFVPRSMAATGIGASLARDEGSGARQDRFGLGDRFFDQAHSCPSRAEPRDAGLQPLESRFGRLELFVRVLAGAGDSPQLDAERILEALQSSLRLERAHEHEYGARDERGDQDGERDPENDHANDATNLPGARQAARQVLARNRRSEARPLVRSRPRSGPQRESRCESAQNGYLALSFEMRRGVEQSGS